MDKRETVRKVFIETIQEMGFLDVESAEKAPCDGGEPCFAVRLSILMPYMGEIVLVMSRPTVVELAQNIYSGPAQSDELLRDAVAEFLNVLVGKIFAVLRPDLLFELGLPEIIDSACVHASSLTCEAFADINGRCMRLCHQFDKRL